MLLTELFLVSGCFIIHCLTRGIIADLPFFNRQEVDTINPAFTIKEAMNAASVRASRIVIRFHK